MNIFTQGANWEATRISDLEKAENCMAVRWIDGILLGGGSHFAGDTDSSPADSSYIVKQDAQTGNLEVLQAFDNRVIGTQELMNKYWARRYVTAREQYNWWLVADDYDTVAALTENKIFKDYEDQFIGEKGLDKVFGDFTDRRIKILSIAPSPTNKQQLVVRFERTTISKGAVVEAPTVFVVNMTYRYNPNTYASEQELIRNPLGFQVFAYRRDVEVPASTPLNGIPAHARGG